MTADDQPWTTSRCNRLLRPISSRISTLRKQLDSQQRVLAEARKASSSARTDSSRKANASQPTRSRKPRCFDPEWAPTTQPTGIKRTYGGRKGNRTGTAQNVSASTAPLNRPGEIISTPFVVRSGSRLFDSPQPLSSPLRVRKRTKGPLISRVTKINDLKKQMSPDIGKLVEGLLDAYAKLLQATHADEPRSRKGPRSLMSTCLQNMPAYMVLEEHFAEVDSEEGDEHERDIADEIYTELQDFFSAAEGTGWQHFKEMVRAHGTSLVADAFADGLLGLEALQAIVELCLKASAWQEAEKLLWTFLPDLKPLLIPTSLHADLFEPSTSAYMRLVKTFVRHTGRHGFLYDLLAYMISQELLPLEWLAADCMQSIWSKLTTTLSEGDDRTFGHAVRFLQTCVSAACGLADESRDDSEEGEVASRQFKQSARQDLRGAIDTTFSSLLALLASAALAARDQDGHNRAETVCRLTWVLDSLAMGLLVRKDIRDDLELLDTTDDNMLAFAQRALWTVTASSVVHIGDCRLSPGSLLLDTPSLVKSLSWISRQYSCQDSDMAGLLAGLPMLISTIVLYTGKARKDDGFDELKHFVDGVLSLGSMRLPHRLWSLKRLVLETCTEYAQFTNDSVHFAYVRQVEALMSSKGGVMLLHSPQKDDTPSAPRGFRLEEGIGEWVPCTPITKQDIRNAQQGTEPEQLPSPAPSGSSGWATVSDVEEETNGDEQRGPNRMKTMTRKRTRASSPIVAIPVKRVRLTIDSYVVSLDNQAISFSSTTIDNGVRRSRRTLKQHQTTVGQRARLSRSSVNGPLRHIIPKNYMERAQSSSPEPCDDDKVTSDEDDSNVEDEGEDVRSPPIAIRAKGISTDIPRRGRGRPRKQVPSTFGRQDEHLDDDDELGKTPFRTSSRLQRRKIAAVEQAKGRRSRFTRRQWALAAGPADDDSEDELSMY